uniref:Uncharacterized protein n=1 Tax=Pyramimonas obovata TaxID=1411642 RepID=A0A7S0MW16_9CHLO|mmetsp:Transcript_14847/g.31888  ORF Transcript_14847/g.31888 Transcript_14847/m.31888 type:complete len:861 (+) Transcript_14847:1073-3655(+)
MASKKAPKDAPKDPAEDQNAPANKDQQAQQEEEPGGFADFLSNLYEEFFAYQTIKLVKMRDWRLALLKRVFNLGIAVYILFFMVFFHGYLEVEVPVVFVSPSFNDSVYVDAQQKNLSASRPLSYKYCGVAEGTPAFTYIFANQEFKRHNNILCTGYATKEEFTRSFTQRATLTTYYRQQLYNRSESCGLKLNRFSSQTSACTQKPVNQEIGVFIKDAEQMQLQFTAGYTTSRGDIVTKSRTIVQGNSCTQLFSGSCIKKSFKRGEPVIMTLEDILSMAGVKIDDQHEDSGGLGINKPEANGTEINTVGWPSYRMTGMELTFQLEYTNFANFRWFTGDADNTITVTFASEGGWRSTGLDNLYMGGDRGAQWPTFMEFDDHFYIQQKYGVVFSFVSGGLIGTPTYTQFVITMLSSLLLFAVATSGIDIIAALMIKGFKESKLEEDMELRMRQTLRDVLKDVVPKTLQIDVDEEQEASTQAIANLFFCCGTKSATEEEKRKKEAAAMEAEKEEPEINALVIDGEPYHGQLLRLYGKPKRTYSANIQWQMKVITGIIEDISEGISEDGESFGGRSLGSSSKANLSRLNLLRRSSDVSSVDSWASTVNTRASGLSNGSDAKPKKKKKYDTEWQNIPEATHPEFFATAEYVGKSIRVRVTPISKDGVKGVTETVRVSKVITFPRVLKRIKHFNTLKEVRFNVVVKPNPLTKTAERSHLTIDLMENKLRIKPSMASYLQPSSGEKKKVTDNLFKKDMSHDPPVILPKGCAFEKKKRKFEARLRPATKLNPGEVLNARIVMSKTNHKMMSIDKLPPKESAAHFECESEEERDIIYLLIVKTPRLKRGIDPNLIMNKPDIDEQSEPRAR